MDPLIRDQIKELQDSDNPQDRAQATILEVLVQVREQTTKTNGRVNALESKMLAIGTGCPGKCVELETRLAALETPAKKISLLWGVAGSALSGAVIVLGLVFTFLATPMADRMLTSKEDAVAVAVEKAVEDKLKSLQGPTPAPSKRN